MNVSVQKSFEKDIAAVTDRGIARKALLLISTLESIRELSEIPHLKKMTVKGIITASGWAATGWDSSWKRTPSFCSAL